MWLSNFRSAMLTAASVVFLSGYHALSYSDLEALGVNCPDRDRCEGYKSHLTYEERSCECDYSCTTYNDCCIDALPSTAQQVPRSPPRTDVECLHFGEDRHAGVYAISKCSSDWNGPAEVKEKCEGRISYSDPLKATPVTDILQNETYRNLACAECNNANLDPLDFFQLKLLCEGASGLPEAEIMGDLTYNKRLHLWGITRLNRFGNKTAFFRCRIIFEVPEYLHNKVRFCRSNLISKCAWNWAQPDVAQLCESYTAAVYSSTAGYKNPHCAICNHKSVKQISCQPELLARRRLWNFELLVDVNPTDGEEVGMRPVPTPACPADHKYDPFFKMCRQLVCALPGHVVENGVCVNRSG